MFLSDDYATREADISVVTFSSPKKRILTQVRGCRHIVLNYHCSVVRKVRRTSKVTAKLAALASETSKFNFKRLLELLQQLVDAWENNRKTKINEGRMQ